MKNDDPRSPGADGVTRADAVSIPVVIEPMIFHGLGVKFNGIVIESIAVPVTG